MPTAQIAKKNWEKHLSVDRRIVRILSVFTYEDFPRSIREMVSNAYDADATEVRIRIDIDKDVIEVSDDGNGMTPDEFDFFLRIAGQKRANRFSPAFHRNRIGQFGIGFLAVFPFGKRVKIISTARRSKIRFEATIPAERYLQQSAESVDVEDIPITGFQEESPDLLEQHGTTIRITGLSDETKRYFKSRHAKKSQKQTIREWPAYDRLRWSLAEDLPIDYAEDSPYREVFAKLPLSGLAVYLNGQELKRNAPGSHILDSGTQTFDGAKCQYVIATDWKAIQPVESRYLKQRIRNVGLGERMAFGLQLEGKTYSRLHWLTGEIRILEGFDELISVDRERFMDSPTYDQFRDFFSKRLSHFALFLETVSEATRDIDRQIKSSRFAEVGSKQEIVQRNVKKLAGRGFEVVHRSGGPTSKKSPPVVVDINRRRVEVIDDHPAFRDTITLDSKEIPVRYLSWNGKDKTSAPVRRARDGAIEINTSYPLFQSGRYGDLFKRVFLVLLMVSEKSGARNSLIAEVASKLSIEFSDLTR